jgi:hypothetical protein
MTITWTINNLERQASDGLVTVVHWGASAVDGEFSASIVNTLQVERGDNFTAFNQLTEQQVLAWVQDAVGKDTVEAALAQMIDAQKQPTSLTGLPWAA